MGFIFLNDIDNKTGATRFLKGTHTDHENVQKIGSTQITDYFDPHDFQNFEPVTVAGDAGTLLLFSQKILHELPEIVKIGRETIWFTFYPKSFSYLSENHLLSRNIIVSLNKNQRERVLFEGSASGPSFLKFGDNKSIADTHKISRLRASYYVLYYRFSIVFRSLFR